MLIYPAIDIMGGACVRLAQGRFDSAKTYGDPLAQLRAFEQAGAAWVHIVDLDGAREGKPVQHDLVRALARASDVKIQCGGGVRSSEHIEALLDAGVSRVVIGSAAARAPDETLTWLNTFGAERLCCAFDIRPGGADYRVAVHGWADDEGRTFGEILSSYPVGSLAHALVTDIARDGMLEGPNVALIRSLVAARPDIQIQASGGVAALRDLAVLREAGAAGAIVGRALYEGRFMVEDALAG
jgi:phosphoribosylformimino-5-aminoimidazole carboxamide ribotide isomerase